MNTLRLKKKFYIVDVKITFFDPKHLHGSNPPSAKCQELLPGFSSPVGRGEVRGVTKCLPGS